MVPLSSRTYDFNSAISIFIKFIPTTGVLESIGSDLMRFLAIVSDRTLGSSLSMNDCKA